MTDFAINPPIHILGRDGIFVRSTEQAAAFVRKHMLGHLNSHAAEVLRRLEGVNSPQEAQNAGKEFRDWIAGGMPTQSSGSLQNSLAPGDERGGKPRRPGPRRSRRRAIVMSETSPTKVRARA
jgi:hypothetical protein